MANIIEALAKLELAGLGTCNFATATLVEIVSTNDPHLATIQADRSGEGFRVDFYLDGAQYVKGAKFSQHFTLVDTYAEAVQVATGLLAPFAEGVAPLVEGVAPLVEGV